MYLLTFLSYAFTGIGLMVVSSIWSCLHAYV